MVETNKYEERYFLYEKCRNFIQGELRKIYGICENQRTFEVSNRIFNQTLSEAKRKAFSSIETSVNKPWVIYMINKYWSF